MPSFQINDAEWSALADEPADVFKLYCAIRRFMDYRTGVSGEKRRLSEQMFREELYIAPTRGRHESGSPTRQKVRSLVDRLITLGAISPIGPLVYQLPNADWGSPSKTSATDEQPDQQPDQQPQEESAKADARWHAGMTVQRAIEIFREEGLDPFEYGAVCHDVWDDEFETVEAVWLGTGRFKVYIDNEGNEIDREEIMEQWADAAERQTLWAGDKFSFREGELHNMMIRALAHDQDQIMQRLAMLES